jgi:hypothetical protein
MYTDVDNYKKKRWFTGTPCNFKGNALYFSRESGLTSLGFAKLGCETGAITLGPPHDDDWDEMTRATWEELESADWWAHQKLNGLVFYTWGSNRYVQIIKAAKKAGIQIAQVTDSHGIISPVSDWHAHIMAEVSHYWYQPKIIRLARTILKIPYTHTIRVLLRDLAHARAIVAGDLFLAPTPEATLRYQKLVRRLVGKEQAGKVRFVPIPTNFHFRFSNSDNKADEIISVGRWDSTQKRTPLLMKTISLALPVLPKVVFRIFGKSTPNLLEWHNSLPYNQRERVQLNGLVCNSELAVAYKRAKIMLVSSAYEGCHNASAEAVCCGASVVGCYSPFLGAVEWHASKRSGRISKTARPEELCKALLDEYASWESGERDPIMISKEWTDIFHPDKVATKILKEFDCIQN